MRRFVSFMGIAVLVLFSSVVFAVEGDSPTGDVKLSKDEALIHDFVICRSLQGEKLDHLQEIPDLSLDINSTPQTGIMVKHLQNDTVHVDAEIEDGIIKKVICTPLYPIDPEQMKKANSLSIMGYHLHCTSTFREHSPFGSRISFGVWRGPKVTTVSYDADDFITGLSAALYKMSSEDRRRLIKAGQNAEVETFCQIINRNQKPIKGSFLRFMSWAE